MISPLQSWLNPECFNSKTIKTHNKSFTTTKPYQHLQIKNFLQPQKAKILLAQLKKETFKEKESDLFHFHQTSDLHFSKNKILKSFHAGLLSWDFFRVIEKITNTKLKGTLDIAGTLYKSANYLLCHDDKLEGRKVAYIIYLSPTFSKKDGGAFILYNSKNNKPTTAAKSYPPQHNSLLLFKVTKNSFHEVGENLSTKNRYALGGWLK